MKKRYDKPSVKIVKTKLRPLLLLSEKGNAVNDTGTTVDVTPSGVKSDGNANNAAARSFNVWGDDDDGEEEEW